MLGGEYRYLDYTFPSFARDIITLWGLGVHTGLQRPLEYVENYILMDPDSGAKIGSGRVSHLYVWKSLTFGSKKSHQVRSKNTWIKAGSAGQNHGRVGAHLYNLIVIQGRLLRKWSL